MFDAAQGLNIAVALVNDEDFNREVDPHYGHVEIRQGSWRLKEDANGFVEESKKVETHRCSQAELGLEDGDSEGMKFYRIKRSQQKLQESMSP